MTTLQGPSIHRLCSLALGSTLALCATVTFAHGSHAQGWTRVGPTVTDGPRLLAIERGAAPGAGVAWLANGLEVATSADRGATWRFSNPAAPLAGYFALSADTSRPRALWAATDDAVLRTEDGGAHWRRLSDDSYRVALGPDSAVKIEAAQGWLFVLAAKRLLASSDGGRSWRPIHELGTAETYRSFTTQPRPGPTPVLYLSSGPYGVAAAFKSLDGGTSWLPLRSPLLAGGEVERLVASATTVYAAVDSFRSGIYRSTDRGETWQAALGGHERDRFTASALAVDPLATRWVYAYGIRSGTVSEERLWVSGDSGATWTRSGKAENEVAELAVEAGTRTLYARPRDGATLWRSLDRGGRWTQVFRSPKSFQCPWAQLSFRPDDPARRGLVIGRATFSSVDRGASWRWLPGFGFSAVDVDSADPRRLIGVGDWFVYVSTDSGASWTSSYISNSLFYAQNLLRLDDQVLLIGGCGVTRTTDDGLTWRETLPCKVTPDYFSRRSTEKLEADPRHPGVVYALGFVGTPDFPHGLLTDLPSFLWRSDDDGGSWTKVTRNLRAFAIDPSDGRVYGARGRTLLASDDFGHTWHTVATTPWPLDDLAVDPLEPERLFGLRGSDGTFACSANGGLNWSSIPRGGPEGTIGRLFIHAADPRVLYAASRFGMSRLPLPASGCP